MTVSILKRCLACSSAVIHTASRAHFLHTNKHFCSAHLLHKHNSQHCCLCQWVYVRKPRKAKNDISLTPSFYPKKNLGAGNIVWEICDTYLWNNSFSDLLRSKNLFLAIETVASCPYHQWEQQLPPGVWLKSRYTAVHSLWMYHSSPVV